MNVYSMFRRDIHEGKKGRGIALYVTDIDTCSEV